jgi:hypothetical protein
MNNHSRKALPLVAGVLIAAFIMVSLCALWPAFAMAQTWEACLEDGLYQKLKRQIKSVERDISDHTRAFDPETGRNFAYDKDRKAWIDTKTGQSVTPGLTPAETEACWEDCCYKCLKSKIKSVERDISDHTRAFDPESGRNFAYDKNKKAWIDTKTGECICPKCPPAAAAGGFQEQTHQNLPVTPQPGTPPTVEQNRGPVTYPNLTYPDRTPPEQSGFGFGLGIGGGFQRGGHKEDTPQR